MGQSQISSGSVIEHLLLERELVVEVERLVGGAGRMAIDEPDVEFGDRVVLSAISPFARCVGIVWTVCPMSVTEGPEVTETSDQKQKPESDDKYIN